MMRNRPAGYTLIELVVVVAMLGVLLGFAAPRVAEQLFTNDVDEVERWLHTTTTDLREKAQRTRKTHVLRIDVAGQQIFIETEEAASATTDTAPKADLKLPDRLHISEVLLGQGSMAVDNQAPIRFFPDGAADPAVLQMIHNNDQRFAWVIEPFLTDISKMEAHGQYADYWQ